MSIPPPEHVTSLEFPIQLAPIGSRYTSTPSEDEEFILRNLLVGKRAGRQDDLLLEEFTRYMASEVVHLDQEDVGDIKEVADLRSDRRFIGGLAAQYALRFRYFAQQETWPKDTTTPGFIFGYVEKWLVDESTLRTRIGGLTIEEYLKS